MKKAILPIVFFAAISLMTANRADAQLSVGVSVNIAPPAIPVYEQPPCPVDGYLWVPGYWSYGDEGYYWVPGYWTAPPVVGYLWTPGYWGFAGGVYGWHAGYWGPHVGFYGGVNYGYGYTGVGYAGGNWVGGHFRYNTAVTHVNTTVIHNTYVDRTMIRSGGGSRVSFNGGPGGINARPDAREEAAMRDRHVTNTSVQVQHQQAARNDHTQLASINHGRPANAAVSRPMAVHSVTPNRSATVHNATPNRPQAVHPAAHTMPSPGPRPVAHPAPHAAPRPVAHPAPHPVPHPMPHAGEGGGERHH